MKFNSNFLTSIPNLLIWSQSLWEKAPISRLNNIPYLLAVTGIYKKYCFINLFCLTAGYTLTNCYVRELSMATAVALSGG